MELCAPDEVLDGISFQVLTAFSYALHVLRPSKAPGFAYAWLELISNRIFIARMLHLTPQQKAWAMYAQLLIDQFRFLAPFLRNAELSKPVQLLYKVILSLYHLQFMFSLTWNELLGNSSSFAGSSARLSRVSV